MTDEFPLYAQSRSWDVGIDIPNQKGFLAIFLKEGEEHEQAVPEEWRQGLIRNDRLLYIGISGNLRTRLKQHFFDDNIDKCTFQHSVCAMLRANKNLYTRTFEKGRCCFYDKKPLSNWIQAHCTFTYCKHELAKEEAGRKKEEFIRHFKPPLNDTNNPSPHPLLKSARSKF